MKFVEWPAAAPSAPLTVCFAEADAIHAAMARSTDGKHIGTRLLAVRTLGASDPISDCNVIYFGTAAAGDSPQGRAARKIPVLTVSDVKGFIASGGIVELFTRDNRLRFNIAADNASRVALKVSSALLQLATPRGADE